MLELPCRRFINDLVYFRSLRRCKLHSIILSIIESRERKGISTRLSQFVATLVVAYNILYFLDNRGSDYGVAYVSRCYDRHI